MRNIHVYLTRVDIVQAALPHKLTNLPYKITANPSEKSWNKSTSLLFTNKNIYVHTPQGKNLRSPNLKRLPYYFTKDENKIQNKIKAKSITDEKFSPFSDKTLVSFLVEY